MCQSVSSESEEEVRWEPCSPKEKVACDCCGDSDASFEGQEGVVCRICVLDFGPGELKPLKFRVAREAPDLRVLGDDGTTMIKALKETTWCKSGLHLGTAVSHPCECRMPMEVWIVGKDNANRGRMFTRCCKWGQKGYTGCHIEAIDFAIYGAYACGLVSSGSRRGILWRDGQGDHHGSSRSY